MKIKIHKNFNEASYLASCLNPYENKDFMAKSIYH